MTDIKVVTIVGARPQFVKAATVSRALAKHSNITEIMVHTGQHYDDAMSSVFFEEMEIPRPHYQLSITGKTHATMTAEMMVALEPVLKDENPDYVLVYGDTNSTLAGALTASKLGLRIAHVEAGLRSFNQDMPEEINRIVTDRLSALLFCPTQVAIDHLKREGMPNDQQSVLLSGDVMQDGADYYASRAQQPEQSIPDTFALLTLHRAENTDDPETLKSLVNELNALSEDIAIVFPVHPRTKQALKRDQLDLNSNIFAIEPVGYLEMVWLIQHSTIVLTDSGGLQKEAFFFSKPCVTLRNETEWQELVDNGFNQLVGSKPSAIAPAIKTLLEKQGHLDFNLDLYGNGQAAERIAISLIEHFSA